MKYLALLLIVLGGIWWFRQQRPKKINTPQENNASPRLMVPCAHCGTHIPESDATQGQQGVYCSVAHRQAHEG